ncbi:hypothetical protein GCM10027615_69050 [Plantactinospora veratri]
MAEELAQPDGAERTAGQVPVQRIVQVEHSSSRWRSRSTAVIVLVIEPIRYWMSGSGGGVSPAAATCTSPLPGAVPVAAGARSTPRISEGARPVAWVWATSASIRRAVSGGRPVSGDRVATGASSGLGVRQPD